MINVDSRQSSSKSWRSPGSTLALWGRFVPIYTWDIISMNMNNNTKMIWICQYVGRYWIALRNILRIIWVKLISLCIYKVEQLMHFHFWVCRRNDPCWLFELKQLSEWFCPHLIIKSNLPGFKYCLCLLLVRNLTKFN